MRTVDGLHESQLAGVRFARFQKGDRQLALLFRRECPAPEKAHNLGKVALPFKLVGAGGQGIGACFRAGGGGGGVELDVDVPVAVAGLGDATALDAAGFEQVALVVAQPGGDGVAPLEGPEGDVAGVGVEAQAAGVELTIGQQLQMMLMLMLTTKGIAAVPRASLVILMGTLASFNLPLAGVALAALLVAFSAVGGRLVQLQVVSPEGYAARGAAQRHRVHTLPAERGSIFDRNGKVLVENRHSFTISIVLEHSTDLELHHDGQDGCAVCHVARGDSNPLGQ